MELLTQKYRTLAVDKIGKINAISRLNAVFHMHYTRVNGGRGGGRLHLHKERESKNIQFITNIVFDAGHRFIFINTLIPCIYCGCAYD